MKWMRRGVAALLLPMLLGWIACAAADTDGVVAVIRFFLMLVSFLGIAQFVSLVPAWLIYRGAVNRRVADISAQNRPVPGLARPVHNTLVNLGFQRLGETDTPLPGRRETVSWLYCNAGGSINAELVVVLGAAVQFNTVFADHAILETSYPFGENITRENYRSVRVMGSVEAALRRHLEIGNQMILEHGQPIAIADMPTYLAWDVRYRQMYTKTGKLGASYRRSQNSALLGVYAAAWLLTAWLMVELQGELSAAGLVLLAILTLAPPVWMIVRK